MLGLGGGLLHARPCAVQLPCWPHLPGLPHLLPLAAGKTMYESDDIIQYLFTEYGDGNVPLALRLGFATTLTCGLALAPR